jgi:hypothetical protein
MLQSQANERNPTSGGVSAASRTGGHYVESQVLRMPRPRSWGNDAWSTPFGKVGYALAAIVCDGATRNTKVSRMRKLSKPLRQSGTTVLQIANSNPQNVLSLLR